MKTDFDTSKEEAVKKLIKNNKKKAQHFKEGSLRKVEKHNVGYRRLKVPLTDMLLFTQADK